MLWLSSWLLWGVAAAHHLPHLSPRATTVPAPIVIPASQEFEGNDGPWSSFTLRLGTPEQNVNVMISTASYQTWAVVPQGCISSDPSSCGKLRGGEFNYNQSSTWTQNNVTTNGTFTLGLELNLDYSGNGLYGYDTVALGWQGSGGPSLNQQILAGIAIKEFYFGVFGLNPRPTNFTNYNHPVPSYMSNLKEQNFIPSLSWSYTAGNQYRLDKVLGSLTLGGYDASRFEPNDLVFEFDDQDIKDLSVQISSITYTQDSTNITLLPTPISAFVDSTIPYIYLPLAACKKFEAAFGIEWDNNSQAYLVNDTLHKKLQSDNATVTFTLYSTARSGQVEIALPYAAFDMIAEYPLAVNSTRYFPLMRATNDTQYTLGRTFLQEAQVTHQHAERQCANMGIRRYLTADYERRTFTVSQCTWNAGATQDIIPIKSLDDSGNQKTQTFSSSHHTSTGAIAGGVVGGIAGLALLCTAGYFIFTKFIRGHHRYEDNDKVELDGEGKKLQELDSKDGAHEIGGEQHFGYEIDSKRILGFELAGVHKHGHELDSGQHGASEMPAREALIAELH